MQDLSADLPGQFDDGPLRAAEIAEPIAIREG
jgi:hypothetical protein